MLPLNDAVRQHCHGLEAGLVERHLRRMPAAYFERFAVTEVARHVRRLADVSVTEPVSIETRELGRQVFEVLLGCVDYPGALACVTSALAADQFNLEDVQI